MRLGAHLFKKFNSPEEWGKILKNKGYTAAYCPVGPEAEKEVINEYSKVANSFDIVIAEVGAWSNPLSDDEIERKEAKEKCKKALCLADEIGANCCVNIAGSRGKKWDGPDKKNLTRETFDMIVEVVREIIDEVNPVRSFYTLETMPWIYPNSAESYLNLIKAIDRKYFAVHFDPVNLINCPERYFKNGEVIKDFISKLGSYIRSCHAKDILLQEKFIIHLDEVRPGTGVLDYRTYLCEINRINQDIPLMLEHLSTEEEYDMAAEYIRSVAREEGIVI